MMTKALTAILVIVFMSSCTKYDDSEFYDEVGQFQTDTALISRYMKANAIDAEEVFVDDQPTGIYMSFIEEGVDRPDVHPLRSSVVYCSYEGKLLDGTVVTKSLHAINASLALAHEKPGLGMALANTSVGDSVQILIPSYYAYQNVDYLYIPKNSVLVYNIRVKSFDQYEMVEYIEANGLEAEKIYEYGKDTGLFLAITETGDTNEHPTTSNTVEVRYNGYLLDGFMFDQTEQDSTLNEPLFKKGKLVEGVRKVLPYLSKGDKASIIVPSELGFGPIKREGIPANSVLRYDLELVDFD